MTADLVYIDDPFEDGEVLRTEFAYIDFKGLAVDAMRACKRSGSAFRDTNELHRWQRLEKMILQDTITEAWCVSCIEWAAKMNKGKRATIISFDTLWRLMSNESKYEAWASRQEKGHEELHDLKTHKDYG